MHRQCRGRPGIDTRCVHPKQPQPAAREPGRRLRGQRRPLLRKRARCHRSPGPDQQPLGQSSPVKRASEPLGRDRRASAGIAGVEHRGRTAERFHRQQLTRRTVNAHMKRRVGVRPDMPARRHPADIHAVTLCHVPRPSARIRRVAGPRRRIGAERHTDVVARHGATSERRHIRMATHQNGDTSER